MNYKYQHTAHNTSIPLQSTTYYDDLFSTSVHNSGFQLWVTQQCIIYAATTDADD